MGVPSSRYPPTIDNVISALFLDLDGTLALMVHRPEQVGPEPHRTWVLRGLVAALGGRVAVLTGRTLEDADRILEDAVPCIGAVHGLVRRDLGGQTISAPGASSLEAARKALVLFAEGRPGVLVEDKEVSLAVHYRLAPEAAQAVAEETARLARQLDLTVQAGAMVSELRPHGPDKGDALDSFMATIPFRGARPIMVGDDLTDEAAFAAAERRGGYGVLVGPARETHALYRLDDVSEVLAWLEGATG